MTVSGGFGGYTDWRLPNIRELASIVERKCYSPSINLTFFPNQPSAVVWTGSAFTLSSDARIVSFNSGTDSINYRTHSYYVRLVRGGNAPPSAPTNLTATAGDGSISYSWESVSGAESYNLYLAEESGVTPDNYGSLIGGQMIAGVTSPSDVTGLTNDTTYYAVVTALANGLESSASNEVSATPVESTVGTGILNDTGLIWGGDYPEGNNSTCTGETISQQDCSHGRDVTANDDSDGVAGFSFTKLGANGEDLAADATEWYCVRDNVTGLIWEVKQGGNGTQGDEGLHDADDTYNWYNTQK